MVLNQQPYVIHTLCLVRKILPPQLPPQPSALWATRNELSGRTGELAKVVSATQRRSLLPTSPSPSGMRLLVLDMFV